MDGSGKKEKRQEIIEATWQYLLKNGLSKSSIGELCRETKLSQSSLYHWFANKDDIWINAGKYGLTKVMESMFRYTIRYTEDIRGYFDTLLDEVENYKQEIRLAVQITTSPIFGERMREKSKDFRAFYERYAEELVEIFGCDYSQAEIFIYSVIAYVVDYAIWDDRIKSQMLLDNLYERVADILQITEGGKE